MVEGESVNLVALLCSPPLFIQIQKYIYRIKKKIINSKAVSASFYDYIYYLCIVLSLNSFILFQTVERESKSATSYHPLPLLFRSIFISFSYLLLHSTSAYSFWLPENLAEL
ncbi:hypothetical protein H5410_015868 [Solanum commersonii]|uniref:Uncharacterized protein n=1 Tax=Solanum commersonii TaxID=4109 RepID=A0A9J5ZVN8_SOLCO|nr:hypothetical protein H5410_015868 [Solanum commersonii]